MSFLIALGIALVMTPVARRAGLAIGVVDRPGGDELKIHRGAVSALGGAAVVAGALIAAELRAGVPASVLGCVAIAFGTGLADDVRPLSAWSRLMLLSGAGLVLAAGGARIDGLAALGVGGAGILVVVCANGVNILDGQDGLAGGLAAIAALGLAGVGARAGGGVDPLALSLAGALAGFLVWNRSPARIFLGNGGAYGVGALLASAFARTAAEGGSRRLLACVFCLGVIAFELAFTILRRLGSRSSLASGDRLHSYDLLSVQMGSRDRATEVFWIAGAAACGLALLISRTPTSVALSVTAISGVTAAVAGRRLWTRRTRAPKAG